MFGRAEGEQGMVDMVLSQRGAPDPAARAERRRDPAVIVLLLIVGTLAARLVFADALGLGIDESYMVASGRELQLSYFDHPPLSWWMAWGAAHLFGSEAPIVVRLPFALTFCLTTWLMHRVTALWFGQTAGMWAAVALNLSPVFGVTTASWVLPDGPLLAALLGATLCLQHAVAAERGGWGWWLGAGGCAGLALLSKYSAVLPLAGAAAFLLTQPGARRWLLRPQPFAAGLLAALAFTPVLVWNAQHGWASLLFQGGRAGVRHLRPLGPLVTLAGEALFVLPWIWLALAACFVAAIGRGRRDSQTWLFVCLAAPALLLFLLVSLWTRVLYHWASPGYLMLFPLLGAAIARRDTSRRPFRLWLGGAAAAISLAVVVVGSEVRYNWLPPLSGRFGIRTDPVLAAVDWISVRDELARRGWLDRTDLVVAATRWMDAGKIDYALGGALPVVCLGDDPRQYGLSAPTANFVGRDVLIVAPRTTLAQARQSVGDEVDDLEPLAPAPLRHAGRTAMMIPLYLGRNLHLPQDD